MNRVVFANELVNAIEHVIIPRTENTIKCMKDPPLAPYFRTTNMITDINSELDELDREEFYRLKKVSNKKQRDQAAADKEILAQREKNKNAAKPESQEAADVLGEHEDDDVIF